MKEDTRQVYSARLGTGGLPDAEFRDAISRLKPGERFEILSDALAMHGSNPPSERVTCLQELLPALLGEDYVRGLKGGIAAKRLAVLVKAARRIGGTSCEASALAEILRRSGVAGSHQIEPDVIVAAARIERPSIPALAQVLGGNSVADFSGLATWTRLASISSALINPADGGDLIRAIDGRVDRLGKASNVVPPELFVLRRSLGRSTQTSAGTSIDGGSEPPPIPQFNPARALQDLGAYLNRVEISAAEAEAALAQVRIDKVRTEQDVSRLETRVRELESTTARQRADLEDASRELDRVTLEVTLSKERARELEAKLHATEALLQGASDSSGRSAQRKLREQCGPLLEEVGDYVKLAASSSAFDVAKLERSFARLVKTFRRATGAESDPADQKA